jgi:hypothetical protein
VEVTVCPILETAASHPKALSLQIGAGRLTRQAWISSPLRDTGPPSRSHKQRRRQ